MWVFHLICEKVGKDEKDLRVWVKWRWRVKWKNSVCLVFCWVELPSAMTRPFWSLFLSLNWATHSHIRERKKRCMETQNSTKPISSSSSSPSRNDSPFTRCLDSHFPYPSPHMEIPFCLSSGPSFCSFQSTHSLNP